MSSSTILGKINEVKKEIDKCRDLKSLISSIIDPLNDIVTKFYSAAEKLQTGLSVGGNTPDKGNTKEIADEIKSLIAQVNESIIEIDKKIQNLEVDLEYLNQEYRDALAREAWEWEQRKKQEESKNNK